MQTRPHSTTLLSRTAAVFSSPSSDIDCNRRIDVRDVQHATDPRMSRPYNHGIDPNHFDTDGLSRFGIPGWRTSHPI